MDGEQPQQNTSHAKPVALVAVGVVVLAVVAVGGYYAYNTFMHSRQAANPYARVSVKATLMQQNQDFVAGLAFFQGKNFDRALASFQAALTSASDEWQKGLIGYYIGFSQEKLGQYAAAIDTYKGVGANTAAYPIIRAYAVQEIGLMYQIYFAPQAQSAIVAATFTGDPYASFKVDGPGDDYNASYIKLFEYAASIYPLATAESYIADGYATSLSSPASTTTPVGQETIKKIKAALDATTADLTRMLGNGEESGFIWGTILRQAVVEDRLVRLGVPGYDFDQVEALYAKAVASAASADKEPGNMAVWLYGNALARMYGEARAADIKRILAPFSVGSGIPVDPMVTALFKQVENDPAMANEKVSFVKVARIDPDFMAYLESLGWHASDFASN